MRALLGLMFVTMSIGSGFAAAPPGPACQTFVGKDGTRIMFPADDTAVIRAGDKLEACGTTYLGGEDDYEPSIDLRCGPNLAAFIDGDEATFPHKYTDKTFTFRGETFTRNCK